MTSSTVPASATTYAGPGPATYAGARGTLMLRYMLDSNDEREFQRYPACWSENRVG